ncbi:hypothetical protein DFH08DRAFT_942868 [Mycena albidolilacea]|uniref:Uncharacterized protein n=1 Tax=Mycena albidolilacea TaxID=1033008 RepID=A0AAD6ZCC9_9AGAR|nr:hypothetical protein DFH08DRAFT_942868 [Mycena albidolilacea]
MPQVSEGLVTPAQLASWTQNRVLELCPLRRLPDTCIKEGTRDHRRPQPTLRRDGEYFLHERWLALPEERHRLPEKRKLQRRTYFVVQEQVNNFPGVPPLDTSLRGEVHASTAAICATRLRSARHGCDLCAQIADLLDIPVRREPYLGQPPPTPLDKPYVSAAFAVSTNRLFRQTTPPAGTDPSPQHPFPDALKRGSLPCVQSVTCKCTLRQAVHLEASEAEILVFLYARWPFKFGISTLLPSYQPKYPRGSFSLGSIPALPPWLFYSCSTSRFSPLVVHTGDRRSRILKRFNAPFFVSDDVVYTWSKLGSRTKPIEQGTVFFVPAITI